MAKEFYEHLLKINTPKRLQQQVEFIMELDKLKQIIRQSSLLDQSRKENDAEHSWHIAIMAMILAEYASPEVNINRVIRMLLIHDIVEIDAGDVFLYEQSLAATLKQQREHLAAERIYGFLPMDIGAELISLWQEFEHRQTPDAIFARALDRLQPLLHNFYAKGGTWKRPEVTAELVISMNIQIIQEASPLLWEFAETLIKDADKMGYFVQDCNSVS